MLSTLVSVNTDPLIPTNSISIGVLSTDWLKLVGFVRIAVGLIVMNLQGRLKSKVTVTWAYSPNSKNAAGSSGRSYLGSFLRSCFQVA
jgi:hypothetical protein